MFKGLSSLAYVIATTAMWGWYDSGALIPQLVLGVLYTILGVLTVRLWRLSCLRTAMTYGSPPLPGWRALGAVAVRSRG